MKTVYFLCLLNINVLIASDSLVNNFKNFKRNQNHLKIGGNHNFKSNSVKFDIGILRNDCPFSLHRHGEWSEIINHNTFISTEINIGNYLFIGPKIGYEFNYVFFQGRINLIEYIDFNGNNNLVLRPDLGITLFGLCSLSCGYNISLYHYKQNFIQPYTIALIYNRF